MADFSKAIDKLIRVEGGYVNDPQDPGGETKFGISKRSYPHLDIRMLTVEDAHRIYKTDYWDRLNLDYVKNQKIAQELFDTAVNCGTETAAHWLQESLNLLHKKRITVDGRIGSQTLSVLNASGYAVEIMKVLNGFQFIRYLKIVDRDPTQKKFFRNWLRRIWERH